MSVGRRRETYTCNDISSGIEEDRWQCLRLVLDGMLPEPAVYARAGSRIGHHERASQVRIISGLIVDLQCTVHACITTYATDPNVRRARTALRARTAHAAHANARSGVGHAAAAARDTRGGDDGDDAGPGDQVTTDGGDDHHAMAGDGDEIGDDANREVEDDAPVDNGAGVEADDAAAQQPLPAGHEYRRVSEIPIPHMRRAARPVERTRKEHGRYKGRAA